MRTTSAEAYKAIVESKYITKARRQVVDWLYMKGDCTGEELDGYAGTSAHKRLSELETMGVVAAMGFKTNTTTGHKAILWGLTGKAPNADQLPGVPVFKRPVPRAKLLLEVNNLGATLLKVQHALKDMVNMVDYAVAAKCNGGISPSCPTVNTARALLGMEVPNAPANVALGAAKVPISWHYAGGPNECKHGYAEGIPCPHCPKPAPVKSESRVAACYRKGTEDWAAEYDMLLPDGITCDGCAHFGRCTALFRCGSKNTKCDFYPSRYRALPKVEEYKQCFFTVPGVAVPSAYFITLKALKESAVYKANAHTGNVRIWEGTHELPIPVEEEEVGNNGEPMPKEINEDQGER